MEKWKKRWGRHGAYWYREMRLHDGWKVRMEFWVLEFDPERDPGAVVEVSLVAYRGASILRWGWRKRKEGVVNGPGGTAVGAAALRMLREIERVAPTKTDRRYVEMAVTGATPRLYAAYKAVLMRRGYHETKEFGYPELTKILR